MRGFFLGPIIVLITYSIALAWGENSWNDNGEHYSVSPCDSIVTSCWNKLDNVSVTNGIMTNYSQQGKHVDVLARVYTKSHHSSI
jgi:hypothetical protein